MLPERVDMSRPTHTIKIDGRVIETPRLILRPWQLSDAPAALTIFGAEEVTRWLAPSVGRIADETAMRAQLQQWIDSAEPPPVGYWAVVRNDLPGDSSTDTPDHQPQQELVGSGQIIPMPPGNRDLLVGFEVHPDLWGSGYGTEVGHALAHYAFENGLDEIFAVVRTRNERAQAVTEHIGMQWVGETEKYFDLRLNVYRLRRGELDRDPLHVSPVP